ncbi:MAG: NAD(P)/FAD-dependent oxidoreductase [Candidatus Manganitrophaceae bacterium]|nr:MAG: NAD(P)/FAD-dependent oxidoreductase [Candidatus Manganitrophaceae bacterium]
MSHNRYLIVGGGMTADAAVRGIRQVDPDGSIGLISREADPPYDRPPLTKGLWKGKPLESIWRKTQAAGADLHTGRTVQALDVEQRRVTDDQGVDYTYEKLLLATGGTPRRLPFGDEAILYYRTVADYRRLREMADRGRRFAVIGGGFIGSEIAAALAMNGKEVVMLFPEEGIGSRMFPRDLSRFLNAVYRKKGVAVLPETTAVGFAPRGEQWELGIKDAEGPREIVVDGIVAGIGIEPNTRLAEGAGLTIENGIVVDEYLRTSRPDIYAAGDAVSFFNPALGRRLRVEHEDNANTMGRLAGRNMAGRAERYDHLPFFYSDLFEWGYEAVGDLNPRLDLIADWETPNQKGVVYYLHEGRVRGVLLWNVWGQVEAARRLIAEPGPFRPEALKGRLPEAA